MLKPKAMDEDLSDLMYVFKKNTTLIILLFLVIFAAIVTYTLTTTPIFESKTLVVVSAQDTSGYLLGSSSSKINLETQAQIIQSAAVLEHAYNEVKANFDVNVKTVENSFVIEIITQAANPLTAQKAANEVAKAYVLYTATAKKNDAENVKSFINEQLTVYNSELEQLNKLYHNISNGDDLGEDEVLILRNLDQEIKAKEDLVLSLLSRREEVGIIAREDGTSIKIIEEARLPQAPIKPNIPLNLIAGLLLSAAISYGLAYFKEYIRDVFKSQEQTEMILNIPIIGSLPFVKNKKGDPMYTYLIQHKKRGGEYAEKMRVLRTNLLFSLKENNQKVVAITSPQKGDGKSTTVINLALSLAHNNVRVLLVDANMRNPYVNKVFKKQYEKIGLTDVILGKHRLINVIRKTTLKNLDLIFTGKTNSYPGEMFNSKKMKSLCQSLKEMPYDVILIDNTSLRYTESALMAANTQGVVMVIGHDKTRKEEALHAKAALEKVKSNIIGFVYNFDD